MIINFKDKITLKIWEGKVSRSIDINIQNITRRKLRMLNSSIDINDLRIPPSNRLEKLKGDLSNYYSIRVNDKWRIIFQWKNNNAYNVQLIDYHK